MKTLSCRLLTTALMLATTVRWGGKAATITRNAGAFILYDIHARRGSGPVPPTSNIILSAKSSSSSSAPSSPPGPPSTSKEPDRPPTLPSQEFRPKQSLGQNFLTDQNYVMKIVNAMKDPSPGGRQVVELGCGTGALTRVLYQRYPNMLAVDVDPRAITFIKEKMPSLTAVQSDVLQIEWDRLSELRGGRLSVIGNLPYHITSQILFCLLDNHRSVREAVVTMQWEVAARIVAPPRCKDYGILSVLFQLYTEPVIRFKIPNTVFYPVPKVTSALISLTFYDKAPFDVNPANLKQVLQLGFQQRRKMLRQSLKPLFGQPNVRLDQLPDSYATRRPEELAPKEFIDLTRILFGTAEEQAQAKASDKGEGEEENEEEGAPRPAKRVWRHMRHGDY